MSKEKNLSASETHLPDIPSDPPIDDLISEMFLRMDMDSLAALSEDDIERLSVDTNKEEFQALASIVESEESVDETTSSTDTTIQVDQQQEVLTIPQSIDTKAESDSTIHVDVTEVDFLNSIHNVEKFDKQSRVTFRGTYRKATELGRGGQGIVYRIEGEDKFSAALALKVFSPQSYENLPEFVADMDRMCRLASLIHHKPHDDLVDIHWFGERDGIHSMIMQYIDGFDLRRLLDPQLQQLLKHCVPPKRWEDINSVVYSVNGSQQLAVQPAIAVYIIERVLRGLAALHSRDIVHGDIKPSNIMLTASGSVKIIDIGSAFECNSPPSQHHFTPAYAAPEFLETKTMSKQSDLASVGYMLIELLSGKPITDTLPNPDESTRIIDAKMTQNLLEAKKSLPNRLLDILPQNILASDHLVELCRCLIDPDLNQRFPTADESIVDRKGTYEFNKDLMLAGLGVCNYHEVSQWLANVKQATYRAG